MTTIQEILRLAKYQRKAFRYHDLKEDHEDTQTLSWTRINSNNPMLHLLRAEKKKKNICARRSEVRIEGEVLIDTMAIDAAALSAFRRHQRRSCNHKDMVNVLDIVGKSIGVISVIDDEMLGNYDTASLVQMVHSDALPEIAKKNVAVPYQSVCDIIVMMVDAYVDAFALAN